MNKESSAARIRRMFQCHGCSWFRDVNADIVWQSEKIMSPVYGEITLGAMAQRDIDTHKCEEHTKALKHARDNAERFRLTNPGMNTLYRAGKVT